MSERLFDCHCNCGLPKLDFNSHFELMKLHLKRDGNIICFCDNYIKSKSRFYSHLKENHSDIYQSRKRDEVTPETTDAGPVNDDMDVDLDIDTCGAEENFQSLKDYVIKSILKFKLLASPSRHGIDAIISLLHPNPRLMSCHVIEFLRRILGSHRVMGRRVREWPHRKCDDKSVANRRSPSSVLALIPILLL